MNQDSQMDAVSHTITNLVCSARITSKLEDTETYEIVIHDSPLDGLDGPTYAELLFSPGMDGNYKPGDFVKVLVPFIFGGPKNEVLDVSGSFSKYILGAYNNRTMATELPENPISANDPTVVRFLHPTSQAGIVANKYGDLMLATSETVHTLLKPGGFGVEENLNYSMAQNFRRILSHNSPYFSCEHFGIYSGSDLDDKSSRLNLIDHKVIYRRFVQQTRKLDNWVSTCEGTYAPFVGINNESNHVEEGKHVLFSKAVNFKSSKTQESRATVEMGAPGDSFINIRVDDVVEGEGHVEEAPGATTGLMGNRFKLQISDKGDIDLRAAGNGTPNTNTNAFHLSVDSKGNLTIHSKGKITFSHGDNDEENNSIVMDPDKGIDIQATNGFRVNNQEVVLQSWANFFKKFQAQWVQVTAIGAPAIIHPAIATEFNALMERFGKDGGFTSTGKGPKALGIIEDDDSDFVTV